MEKTFKDEIGRLKEKKMDTDRTRKYIGTVREYLLKVKESCGDEFTDEEILNEFLEEYEKEISLDETTSSNIYFDTIQLNASKELLKSYKNNKGKFQNILSEAKNYEINEQSGPDPKISLKEAMLFIIKSIKDRRPDISEKQLVETIEMNVKLVESKVKDKTIEGIQDSISYLEQYGFVDEYIEKTNKYYDDLNLQDMKLVKRNPIADQKYDKHGKLVADDEEIGVIDTFSSENLNKLSPEELFLMYSYWKAKYFTEREEMGKAISVIKSLDIWDYVLEDDEKNIEAISDDQISAALKKDLALTYLTKCKDQIDPVTKRRYTNFLKENGLKRNKDIMGEIADTENELENLYITINDVAIIQALIIKALKAKDFKNTKWGTLDANHVVCDKYDKNDLLTLVVENQNFRGPLIMAMPKAQANAFFEEEDLNLPTYKNVDNLDDVYCEMMATMYLPSNIHFKNSINKKYKENPESKIIACMAGKPPKKGEER